jgi:uncharacterized protein (TIGR02145 family)
MDNDLTINEAPDAKTTYLITVDKTAHITIDVTDRGTLNAGTSKIYEVDNGGFHIIKAASLDGLWAVEIRRFVETGRNEIVDIELNKPTSPQIGIIGSFTDQRDLITYKTVTIDGITWLGENLRREIAGHSFIKNPEGKYGRYYRWSVAEAACPDGWRLPRQVEFEKLLRFYPGSDVNYLREGGKSNFNAVLGGNYFKRDARTPEGRSQKFDNQGVYGAFWAAEPERSGGGGEVHATVLLFTKDTVKVRTDFLSVAKHDVYDIDTYYVNIRCVKI